MPSLKENEGYRLIRLPEVIHKVGLKKGAIYALQKKGEFPMSIPVTGRAVAWLEHEVDLWIKRKAKNRTDLNA